MTREFDFSRKFCTVDAIEQMLECRAETEQYTCFVDKGIKKALNSIKRTAILRLFVEYVFGPELKGLVGYLIQKRSSITNGVDHSFKVAVIQGSYFKLNLVLVLINKLLKWLMSDGVT